mmetsp:Transcript_39161/g.90428  ORF Transcript_39161/g.90428 Transcript_39161/m.90428 type:complete len:154 (+) Transcript_39161:347-808(+)
MMASRAGSLVTCRSAPENGGSCVHSKHVCTSPMSDFGKPRTTMDMAAQIYILLLMLVGCKRSQQVFNTEIANLCTCNPNQQHCSSRAGQNIISQQPCTVSRYCRGLNRNKCKRSCLPPGVCAMTYCVQKPEGFRQHDGHSCYSSSARFADAMT